MAEGVQSGSPDSLWVVGGFDPQRRSSATVQYYIKGDWSAGPEYPFPVDHAAAATAEGRLYVAGGNTSGVARADVFRLKSGFDGWEAMAPMHHPRGALALVSLGRWLYAIGGVAGGEVATVEQYDTIQNVWSDVAVLPAPRDHLAGFVMRSLACVAGGRYPITARVDCYDPSQNSWSRLPDLPAPTAGAGAGTVSGHVVVAGGEDAAESTLVNHVFRFTGGASWSDEQMLVPRHGIELAEFGGRAWACGGATAAGYQATVTCTSIG